MSKGRQSRCLTHGFTLIELMTAVAVLSLLLLLVSLLFSAASNATKLSGQRLGSDSQARLVFDRMADDFTGMLRRPDVDFHFVKNSGNDICLFFCEEQGYFSSSLTTTTESNMALVGYRINSTNRLERLAKGLSWDVQGSGTSTTYPVVYLASDPLNGSSLAPNTASTILGKWPGIDTGTTTDTNYHVLGDSTFRLEICFLLKDGTYSLVPALSYPGAGNNLTATSAPTSANGYSTYGVGSRWYDTTNLHGYICTYAPPYGSSNAAVWKPLGMADVQAVVVAIAILDPASQKIIASNASAYTSLVTALPDPTSADLIATPPKLMAETWQAAVNQPTFASTVGIPTPASSQVRIYQRYFYLNNP